MAESLREFEEQLEQEARARNAEEVQLSANEYTVGGILVRKDPDGTLFEFDSEKRAWFPKIDADFIAQYQMNYGETTAASEYSDEYWSNPPSDINSEEYRVWYERYCSHFYPQATAVASGTASSVDTVGSSAGPEAVSANTGGACGVNAAAATTDAEADKHSEHASDTAGDAADGKKRKKGKKDAIVNPKPAEPPAWFDVEEDKNSNVYVSGLPDDITIDEFKEFMTKVGVIAFDPIYRKPKLKLYTNPDGSYKGDGRCCYIKSESVDLALQILDGSEIRGHVISVEHAKFELKGQYDPSKKRRKLTKQEKKKFLEKQEKILGWQPEKPLDARPRHERVVVIKHAFLPAQFEKDVKLLNEISADFREECKKYGDVRKVTVYDRHPDGVVTVTFRQPEEADVCIAAVHQRWFDGRTLEAECWDGRTKYMVEESQEERDKRLNKWHSFLEGDSTGAGGSKKETVGETPMASNPTEINTTCSSEITASVDVDRETVAQDACSSSDNVNGV